MATEDGGLTMLALLQIGLAVGATTALASGPIQDDPRVRAFAEAYRPLIDSVTYRDDDVVFTLGGRRIHFQDGRMLEEGRLERRAECDPIFYRYSLVPLTEPPPAPERFPTYCRDAMESLWGRTEGEIRKHARSARFLDHRVFVNDLLLGPLAAIEGDLVAAAVDDPSVAEWIEELSITYSFSVRDIAGAQSLSYHGFGMAIDMVPTSYEGLHVYWRWSRVFDREGWHRIPMEQRWSPPPVVVEIFERHGFVWGGKWAHFDSIHFEYRPEILLYNRLIED